MNVGDIRPGVRPLANDCKLRKRSLSESLTAGRVPLVTVTELLTFRITSTVSVQLERTSAAVRSYLSVIVRRHCASVINSAEPALW